jgi:hypothetical protein
MVQRTKFPTCMAALWAAATLSACAPDAWQNYKATGFNEYLNTVETQCQPLWIGQMYLQKIDASYAGGQQSNFTALLDNASRMYYNRISPAAFRESVQAQVMTSTDARTNRSLDCMIAQLPPDRPRSPRSGPTY